MAKIASALPTSIRHIASNFYLMNDNSDDTLERSQALQLTDQHSLGYTRRILNCFGNCGDVFSKSLNHKIGCNERQVLIS